MRFEQWGGAPSCSNTAVFISTHFLLIKARMKHLLGISTYRSESAVTQWPSSSSKKHGYLSVLLHTAWLFVFWYSCVLAHAHEGVLSPRTSCFAYSRGSVPSYWREEHPRDKGCSQSIHWYSGKIHSIGFCCPGFEPQESALSMETVSGCYELLPSQNSWKSPLPVTAVWWTFVVTVLNKS